MFNKDLYDDDPFVQALDEHIYAQMGEVECPEEPTEADCWDGEY